MLMQAPLRTPFLTDRGLIRRAAFSIAAFAMTALTIVLFVILPAQMWSGNAGPDAVVVSNAETSPDRDHLAAQKNDSESAQHDRRHVG